MSCMLELFSHGHKAPYHCPTCSGAIEVPPRRNTTLEDIVFWLRHANREVVAFTPPHLPEDVFDAFF